MNELKEIKKVDKKLLDKIEHILASELNCEEYDVFYNYFNEIRKPNILIDIKDDENIKEMINNLQSKIDKAIEYCKEVIKEHNNGEYNVSTVELAVKEHKGNIENVLDILKEDK